MKKVKITLTSILSVLLVMYFTFLFILPNVINLDNFSPQITNVIEKTTGFKVQIKGLKLKTAWNLSAGAIINKIDLKYPTGEKFAQINNLEIKLSIIPAIFHKLQLDSVSFEKLIANFAVEKNGTFTIKKYLTKKDSTKEINRFKFLSTMPDVSGKNYKINFIDAESKKIYAVKGENLKITDFILNKKIRIKTDGAIILEKRKQIFYNISLYSKVFPSTKKSDKFNIISVFKNLHKYNLCTNMDLDIKADGTPDEINLNGNLNFDKIYYTINGKTFPQSNIRLKLKENKIQINSVLYTGENKKASIIGVFEKKKKAKFIEIKMQSDKTDISNTVLIVDTILEMFRCNKLKGVKASGDINANFNIKSDFKTLQSSGFLKINNASISHKLYNIILNSISAEVDFSKNSLNIIKSNANLDGQPIKIIGKIDANANADILIVGKKLDLKGFLATIGKTKILKENDITGSIDLMASLNGKLDKTSPDINGILTNVSIKNKISNSKINFSKAKFNADSKGKKLSGNLSISDLKISSNYIKALSIPILNLTFDEKNIEIKKTNLFIANSKMDIHGKIYNYQSGDLLEKSSINFVAQGLIRSNDIKSLFPITNQTGVKAIGGMPLVVRISGNRKLHIKAQLLANSKNHLSVFDISSLKNRTSLINAKLIYEDNNLKIDELTFYSLKKHKGLSQNFNDNISGVKIITIEGKVLNLNNPYFKNLMVSIPNQIETSLPGDENSSLKIKGDVRFDGLAKKPEIVGYLSIPTANFPYIQTNLINLIVRFNKNSITTNCSEFKIADSDINFDAALSNDFSKGVLIKNLNLNSTYLNLTSLSQVLAKIDSKNTNRVNLIIQNGKSHIEKLKVGDIVATNLVSDINLHNNYLKTKNIKGLAYLGKIGGEIGYNLSDRKIDLNLQGRGLNAGFAINAFSSIHQDLIGQLDFDSDISMVGNSKEQLLKNLSGNTVFIISNGKMSTLGKLEHLLYAQNILSNNILSTSLNVIAKAVTVKNTGYYKYMRGNLRFSNGWAIIDSIKTSGPSMSMYITGRCHLIDNFVNLTILGRLSDDVVRVLGPIGEFSMDKLISPASKSMVVKNQYYEDTSMVPDLTPKTELPTKLFKAVISGLANRQNSVKSFKWLSNSKSIPVASQNFEQIENDYTEIEKKKVQVPDFIDSLPDFKVNGKPLNP